MCELSFLHYMGRGCLNTTLYVVVQQTFFFVCLYNVMEKMFFYLLHFYNVLIKKTTNLMVVLEGDSMINVINKIK